MTCLFCPFTTTLPLPVAAATTCPRCMWSPWKLIQSCELKSLTDFPTPSTASSAWITARTTCQTTPNLLISERALRSHYSISCWQAEIPEAIAAPDNRAATKLPVSTFLSSNSVWASFFSRLRSENIMFLGSAYATLGYRSR